ncbi:hypothetical protein RZN05_13095 [Sphingomonas sp. HF-S4]|uniref:Uncharacterized protein n=1 Tax=Sphingomonas agrestis TaxID=3080540 RepID=A0ABU3Y922_9SPHN|nr:hypothetical protein [Sphingomonas sp. HF-S4]MDV3457925.1 hypothetical protein [Sphingomonas sp. HF-S4]
MSFDLSANEQRQLATALGALDVSAPDMIALPDASSRELFCRYWPIARQILGLLRDLPVTPGPVRAAIALTTAAGDATARILG